MTQRSITQKQSDRVSVLDVRMGHAVCVLGLFLLNILLYCGHAQDVLLSIEPNWSTLFTGETVTFICDVSEGEVTDWNYSLMKDRYTVSPYSSEKRFILQPLTTVYSGEYQCVATPKISSDVIKGSNKVSLTVSKRPKAQLREDSPVEDRVTLTCSVGSSSSSSSSSGWTYFWYKGKKTSAPLNTPDVTVLSTGRIRVSRGGRGVFWCRGGRGDPVYYTEYSDPVDAEDTAASSAFPVLLVVGLLCGVFLIFLLLLFLYRCRKSTDSSVMRSQSTNQRPATDHVINQVETQDGDYASLLHGDAVLYETIRGSEEPEHVSNRRRIVILGKTGVGKSSVANTIFGEELFKIDHNANSETSECRAETKPVNGRNITVIDTPGLFDTDRSEEELKSEIVKCITEFAPGPHAFLILLKVEKFTKQEQAVITEINQYFSKEVFKYATVLFTHGEQLPEGQTIEDFIRDNKLVSDLVKKCGGRCHVIDNKYWKNNQQDEYRSNQFQVKELLNTIEKMIEANEGRYYTTEMLQAVEVMIKQEEECISQSSGNMSEEEIREKAKERVYNRLLINLAGITTGALLGALFGVVLMGGEVYKLVKKVLLEPGQCERALPKIAAAAATAAATAGGIAGTAGIAVGTLVGAVTVGGAIKGALRGYDAAEGADTPCEAAKGAAKAVMDDVRFVFEAAAKTPKYKSESEALLSPQSPDS